MSAARPGDPSGLHDPSRLHREAFVFDGHNDLALRVLDGEDPTERLEGGHLDLPRMRAGGMDGGIFALWVDPQEDDLAGRTLRGVDRLVAFLEGAPGFRPVRRYADLEDARGAGDVAALVGVEGGYAVADDLDVLDRLHAAGVRCLTLTWNRPTAWADAAGHDPVHGGLTAFGGRVVDRLQELGILVDVSHASDAVVREVVARAEAPVVASHSGARALVDHPRNLPDDLLEGVASTGGVAGVIFFPGFLDAEHGRRYEAVRRDLGGAVLGDEARAALAEATAELPPVELGRVAAHLRHMAHVAGPAHVGLGSDFDGVPVLPRGMRDARDLPRVTAALSGAGMPKGQVEAALGASFLRVLREVLP